MSNITSQCTIKVCRWRGRCTLYFILHLDTQGCVKSTPMMVNGNTSYTLTLALTFGSSVDSGVTTWRETLVVANFLLNHHYRNKIWYGARPKLLNLSCITWIHVFICHRFWFHRNTLIIDITSFTTFTWDFTTDVQKFVWWKFDKISVIRKSCQIFLVPKFPSIPYIWPTYCTVEQ